MGRRNICTIIVRHSAEETKAFAGHHFMRVIQVFPHGALFFQSKGGKNRHGWGMVKRKKRCRARTQRTTTLPPRTPFPKHEHQCLSNNKTMLSDHCMLHLF